MKALVSNIGSTSFKFRLFDMSAGEREIASGGADRIGGSGSVLKVKMASGPRETARDFADHGAAIVAVLEQLQQGGALTNVADLDVVAFKAVMAGDVEPICIVDDELLAKMEYFVPIAPAHNPAYIAAMRMFRQALPGTPLVAAFEPGFHRTIPERRRLYAVPPQWASKYGIKRYGFHGASHRYIATRTLELQPSARRIISCHLGGSSSISAIVDGQSVANSFGLSPQSGLPQTNRAGEFDPFAFDLLQRAAGMTAAQVLKELGSGGGFAALSGTSGDIRDLLTAIASGSADAKLALDVFTTAVRDFIGAYLVEMGGCDALVFTGGIGQYNPSVRADILKGLAFAGLTMDEAKNAAAGETIRGETRIDAPTSKAALWVMPTNEELVVARQAVEFLRKNTQQNS